MAYKADAKMLMHSRILDRLRNRLTKAEAEGANEDYINLLHRDIAVQEDALKGPMQNRVTTKLNRP